MEKRALGYALIILGLITIFLKPITSMTGMAVADDIQIIGSIWFYVAGFAMIAGGIMLAKMAGKVRKGKFKNLVERVNENEPKLALPASLAPIINPLEAGYWQRAEEVYGEGQKFKVLYLKELGKSPVYAQLCTHGKNEVPHAELIRGNRGQYGTNFGNIMFRADGSYQINYYEGRKLKSRAPVKIPN